MAALKTFDVPAKWTNPDGTLTERARGFLRELFSYVGASTGQLPVTTIGGDGVTTTTFLREDGNFAVPAYPVAANPAGTIGLTAVNGLATSFLRSDAAPALSQAIVPTWTGLHTFSSGIVTTTLAASGAASCAAFTCTTCTPSGAFGCNGTTAQAAATANAAITATAGVLYTAAEQTMLNDIKALLNQVRAALVANGIMV